MSIGPFSATIKQSAELDYLVFTSQDRKSKGGKKSKVGFFFFALSCQVVLFEANRLL